MFRPIALFMTLVAFWVCSPDNVQAQIDHQLLRRLVVFPMKTDAAGDAKVADEAWWQARDELSRSRRFLVASQQFLLKSDALQPRGALSPADAIILGKLLDAHALVTLEIENRHMKAAVYDGENGFLIWRKSVQLHPSLTVGDQLPSLARKLMADFVATIPYQGFTIEDPLIGKPVYEEGDVRLSRVELGIMSGAQIGDLVQWIRIQSTTAAPLFQGGAKVTVFAEGKIVRLEQGVAIVEVLRASAISGIKEYSLVRVPREAERLLSEDTISEIPRSTLTAELVAPESSPMKELAKERRPLMTTLSFISSMAAFLLLAF